MLDKVIEIISKYQGISDSDISPESLLIKDLGLSSYDVIGLIGKFEDEFDVEIPDRKIKSLKTVADIITFLEEL